MDTFTLEDGEGELLLRTFPDGSISFMAGDGGWLEMSATNTVMLAERLADIHGRVLVDPITGHTLARDRGES